MVLNATQRAVLSSGNVIPDSGGTHQWNHLEKGGTTLGDAIGTLDATIDGATWTSGLGTGGAHLDYDGVDDDSVLSGVRQSSHTSRMQAQGRSSLGLPLIHSPIAG